MPVWFLKWRQTFYPALLVSLLWSGSLLFTNRDGEERLAAWWRAETEQSAHGYLQAEWGKQQVSVPAWLEQGRVWALTGIRAGVSLTMGWQIWAGEAGLIQSGVLILATHQIRSNLHRLKELQGQEEAIAVWPNLAAEEPACAVAQARPAALDEKGDAEALRETVSSAKTASIGSPALEMAQSLARLAADLPIGTNLGLLHVLWALVSGNLLQSRGALFPALQRMGLDKEESRRAWAAFAKGKWEISELLTRWQEQVEEEGRWEEHRFGEYRVKAIDLVGFWRPTLQNCPGKHYKAEAGKALPAVVLGMITRVGQMGEQRVPLPTDFIRVDPDDPSEATLTTRLLKHAAKTLADDELAVMDAGFSLKELPDAGMGRFLLRLALNATARRNYLPEYKGKGRHPEWGAIVRPLARTYNGKTLEATPADRQTEWQIEDKKGHQLTIKAEFWDDLVLSTQKVDDKAASFHIVAIHDPRYKKPLLLATPLRLSGETLRELYKDRWVVELLPLSAKQMIGAARQFVHAPESVQRLPELSLLAGAILSYVAAKLPPIPTGFWDRAPKSTPGRLRRALTGQPLSPDLPLPARIRKKNSVTAHLPKGILAHRRQKRAK